MCGAFGSRKLVGRTREIGSSTRYPLYQRGRDIGQACASSGTPCRTRWEIPWPLSLIADIEYRSLDPLRGRARACIPATIAPPAAARNVRRVCTITALSPVPLRLLCVLLILIADVFSLNLHSAEWRCGGSDRKRTRVRAPGLDSHLFGQSSRPGAAYIARRCWSCSVCGCQRNRTRTCH